MSTSMPQYDPTDYGNKPGYGGPLRVGGQSTDQLPTSEENLPSQKSQAVRRQEGDLQLVRDLSRGPSQVRSAGTTYLPRAPGELMEDYRTRLNRSAFYNVLGHTITGLTGFVFRRDIVLGEDVPEQIVAHWENIDNAGTHGDVFARDQFKDAITAGHSLILVEYPQTGGTQTLKDELTVIRPYWVPIKKDQVVSWRTSSENGHTVLTQLVIEEKSVEPKGGFGEREVTRYRVFYRENGVVGFRLLEITEQRTLVEVDAGTYPTQTEIPVAEVTTNGKVSMFESTPPLLDLAYRNILHYQTESDYLYAIHKTNVPVLFGAAIEVSDTTGTPASTLTIGPNTAVFTPNPAAKLEYVSHTGAALGSTEKALAQLEQQMATLGLTMLSPQTRAAETAEAKRIDRSTSDSALAVAARGLEDAIERALYYHARYMRLDTGGSVTVNRDFENLTLSPQQILALSAMVEKGQLTVETLWLMLGEGNVLPTEFDPMEETAKLAAEAEIKRQMAVEIAAQQPERPVDNEADEDVGQVDRAA